MSLESILEHILNEARTQKEDMVQQARQKKELIIKQARQEADMLYQENIEGEKAHLERERQRQIVNARLESKKNLLKAKQELIGAVFEKLKSRLKSDKFKKQQISQEKVREIPEDLDFYLKRIRPDHEAEIAKILFE